MAKIGLKGFWAADFAETSAGITYTHGRKISKAVQLNENKTINETKLYADNGVADSAYAISDNTIDMTPDGFEAEELTKLIGLGQRSVTINGEERTLTVETPNDEGVPVGIAYIVQERIAGVTKHKVRLHAKVKFRPAESSENQTKGENLTFATPSYKGTCYLTDSGFYTFEDEFTTEALAETFIESVFGISTTSQT